MANWKTWGYELTVLEKLLQALHTAVRVGSKSSTFQNRQENIPHPFLSQADDKNDWVMIIALEALTHITLCTLPYWNLKWKLLWIAFTVLQISDCLLFVSYIIIWYMYIKAYIYVYIKTFYCKLFFAFKNCINSCDYNVWDSLVCKVWFSVCQRLIWKRIKAVLLTLKFVQQVGGR